MQNVILEAARQYDAKGICAFAIPADKKEAAAKWGRWQTERPTAIEHDAMFAKPSNLAIVMGEVSGGLACRDFDKLEPWNTFRRMFPRLALTIPIVETASGKIHIYFKLSPSAVAHYGDKSYLRIGVGEGELRFRRCYCIAPPSEIEGRAYRWIREGAFPELDPRDYFLDVAFADLPFADVRAGVDRYVEQLATATERGTKASPIGEGGRHADDCEFLWKLATLEVEGLVPSSVVVESIYAVQSEKPAKRIAYLRSGVLARCKPLGLNFHALLGQARLPSELPPSPPSLKIPNRTEPDRIGSMQHKRAQEDTRDSGGAGISGDSGDSSHEGEGPRPQTQQSRTAPPKLKPYSGPVLKIGELDHELEKEIETAIAATLPSGPGRREELLFELARRLKAIPQCASLEIWAFRELIREWHRRAYEKIGTKPLTISWMAFANAWENVHTAFGETLNKRFIESKTLPIPDCVAHHDLPAIGDVARLCKVLQSKTNGEPFWLAGRELGRLLKVDGTTGWRWLCLGCNEGWLVEARKGIRGKSSEYFYLGD